jgi:D-3-phosphoglycerate dehydrogenase
MVWMHAARAGTCLQECGKIARRSVNTPFNRRRNQENHRMVKPPSQDTLIFVALSTFAERNRRPLDMLESSGVSFRLHPGGKRITTGELQLEGRDAAVIIAGVEPYDSPTLGELPALRCLVRCGVGVDSVDLAAAKARGITVLNTPDVTTAAVAELALTMFLTLRRNLRAQAASMARREWTRLEAHLLTGSTVGLIGLGRIGKRVAELCQAFGARVLASDPFVNVREAMALGVELVHLDQLLREGDIISLHAARSAAPIRLAAAELAAMKKGTVLVNLARGGMVDESALVDALGSGHLAGAGMDVFADEPYSGPLCDFENVILTPHSATTTVETRAAMELECVDKALRFIQGGLRPEERIV